MQEIVGIEVDVQNSVAPSTHSCRRSKRCIDPSIFGLKSPVSEKRHFCVIICLHPYGSKDIFSSICVLSGADADGVVQFGFLARFAAGVQLRGDFRLIFEARNTVVEKTKVWATKIEENDTRKLACKEPDSIAEFSW
jgi:hypothetical protein